MKRKLWNGAHKVYLASMEKDGETYLKVGTTSYLDALDRFNYSEEKHPIRETFTNLKIVNSVIVPNKQSAERVEKEILYAMGPKRFRIDTYCTGITEIRRNTPQRFELAMSKINRLKK